jgi:tripeptide aminopeptidase
MRRLAPFARCGADLFSRRCYSYNDSDLAQNLMQASRKPKILALAISSIGAVMSCSGYGADLFARPDIRKALDYIQTHERAQIEKQIAIAQIAAPPFHEHVRANAMAQEFRRAHLQDVDIDPIGNVLGWRRGASSRAIVVAAHLDTVFPPGTDVTVKRSGARLTGPGLVDDTRGLTAILALAEALDAAGVATQRSILFVADVGEEGLGDLRGIKYVLGEGKYRDRVDAFISIDGDGENRVVNREMGSRRYRVTISGPGGHSFLNFGRVNPAHALGRIVAHLADLQPPASPKTTYNVGRIGGGTSVNSIPFEIWMEFDMRSEEEGALIELEESFLKLVREGVEEENRFRAGSGTSLKLDAKRVAIRHAVSSTNNADLVAAAKWSSASLGLGEVLLYVGSTDSNAAMTKGIPAITIDGGGRAGNLHSLEEWFEPQDSHKGIQKALLTILKFDQQTSLKESSR